jgi:hypothetical protein
MKILVALLVIANITFFAYAQLSRMSESESNRLQRQMAPEKVKLLTPQQGRGARPGQGGATGERVPRMGPLHRAGKAAALAALEPLQLGRTMTQRRSESTSAFWVFVPPLRSRAAAEKRVEELKALGLKEYFILGDGAQRNAISLGVFKTEDTAAKFLEAVHAQGVANAQSGARTQTIQQTTFVLRDPQPGQAERLQQLKAEFAGSDVKIGPCG